MTLKGKGVLVTGGGTGIGRSIALALAQEGCSVAVAGRREPMLRQTASLWRGSPPIRTCTADTGDPESIEKLFAWASREFGPVHILVNNAGINVKNRSLARLAPEEWDRMLRVNAGGAYHCIRRVLPQMRERKEGLIINISSVSGKRASLLGGVGYSASKFAMSALGTAVALEEGKNGIRVTNIYPGEVDTPILKGRPQPVTPEHRATILQPEDVAAAVVLVANLPPRAHIPELVIKPTAQDYA